MGQAGKKRFPEELMSELRPEAEAGFSRAGGGESMREA